MIEKLIYLSTIDPVLILGINNGRLNKIQTYFPKLKIVSRGDEIKLTGDPNQIHEFEKRLELLIKHYNQYNRLSDSDVENIIQNEYEHIQEKYADKKTLVWGNHGKMIKARTAGQQKMIDRFAQDDLIFAIGPAGTGKTYMAIALAVKALRDKQVKRIVLSRPAVEAGEKLGFLPGDLKEKLDPYMQALYDALRDMFPARKLADLIEQGVIEIAPLAFMRGRTLTNSAVILDEAQNASLNQLKMFLTRMGENSKFLVTGDITQIDLPDKSKSGLVHSQRILKDISGVSFVLFSPDDVVRHRLVKKIIDAYDKNANH